MVVITTVDQANHDIFKFGLTARQGGWEAVKCESNLCQNGIESIDVFVAHTTNLYLNFEKRAQCLLQVNSNEMILYHHQLLQRKIKSKLKKSL